MGRVLDVVWYDLSVTKAKPPRYHTQSNPAMCLTRVLCVTLNGQKLVRWVIILDVTLGGALRKSTALPT